MNHIPNNIFLKTEEKKKDIWAERDKQKMKTETFDPPSRIFLGRSEAKKSTGTCWSWTSDQSGCNRLLYHWANAPSVLHNEKIKLPRTKRPCVRGVSFDSYGLCPREFESRLFFVQHPNRWPHQKACILRIRICIYDHKHRCRLRTRQYILLLRTRWNYP